MKSTAFVSKRNESLERYKCAAAARAALEATRRLAPVSEIVVRSVPETPRAVFDGLPVPVQVQAAVVTRQDARRHFQARRLNPFLLGVLAVPATGLLAALVLPKGQPAQPTTAPVSVASTPRVSPLAIERRTVAMTPPVSYGGTEPALPGSIRFAALTLPTAPPDIPAILPPHPPQPQALVLPPLSHPTTAPEIALAAPAPVEPAPLTRTAPVALAPTEPVVATATPRAQCQATIPVATAIGTPPRDQIGVALAAAALAQISQFVVYDARYTRIAFPGGDVASIHGVCTDVVIRAYRALGIDLQRLVHDARLGSGDTSIDHRRTETLRRFLATRGKSLPITDDPADYKPGDIVTYYRPQNHTSTAHIAIVSAEIAPSGRPMIIHNRGLGVQLEDALFVDRMTGRYRYAGPETPQAPVAIIAGAVRPTSTTLRGANARGAPPAATAAVVRGAANSVAASKLWLRHASGRVATQASSQPR